MTYHLNEYVARDKIAEIERTASDPGRLMAHELRLARSRRRRPRRAR
ncbi:hypothetical protein [Nocardioides sp. GXQ0305]